MTGDDEGENATSKLERDWLSDREIKRDLCERVRTLTAERDGWRAAAKSATDMFHDCGTVLAQIQAERDDLKAALEAERELNQALLDEIVEGDIRRPSPPARYWRARLAAIDAALAAGEG